MTDSDHTLRQHADRRKGPDLLLRAITFFGVGCWIIMVVAMIFFHLARPPLETVATRSANIYQRATWEQDLAETFAILMLAGLFISTTGLALNARRIKRKDDQLRINLFMIWFLSLGGLLLYVFVVQL